MSLALSTYVLFVLLMLTENGAHILSIIFFTLLFRVAAVPVFVAVIVLMISIYGSL